jgi:class 3 adenylate cyclase/tetratricopeptide (TPR) repeat protein
VTVCASCGRENPADARFCNGCGAALTAAPREVRKTVTVLFCDVVASTALGERLDPEPYRVLLARYFELVRAKVESHGGTVDKFIGDAVEAVFGLPLVHEDDALRACRAAIAMRDAVPELGLQVRLGIATGEVVAGTAERLVTGDAVNVAARFEQTARPGEVLIGIRTYELVRDAVVVEPVEALELKGKSESVPAFRLLSMLAAPERSHASRFVGRERELKVIFEAWERVQAEFQPELVTVVGEAGVGKSRLVAEALGQIDARVVRGRCLPYGHGITYWPVVDVVKQIDSMPSDEAAEAAVRSLLGESEPGVSADEIAWAFRKLLEEHSPLVVVFDDLQWGEETFLDLVEATSLLSSGARLLVLCMARPELVERRPSWPAPLRLMALAPAEAEQLIGDALSEGERDRIARAAGGNPLFITEMLAMVDNGDDQEVPPTLSALLVMRLDQLEADERRVLECGSVEGEIFHRGGVQALSTDGHVTPRLARLVRKGLIRPDRAQLAGDDAFRFHHLLIRDAAYDALPKSLRAELHQRFAAWLEAHGRALVELDELLGYHLEQAARYLEELGRENRALALAAGDRLGAAGRRAFWRSDFRTASSLFERALSLSRPYRLDLRLELQLARALYWTDVERAVAVAHAAADRAAAAGDEADAALARTVAALARFQGGQCSSDELERLALEALPLLEVLDDDDGLAHIWHAFALIANMRQRNEEWALATETALRHARRAGHPTIMGFGWALPLAYGPRPASEALAVLDAGLADRPDPRDLLLRGLLLAMLNRTEEAWAVALAAEERLREFGATSGGAWRAEIALVMGDDEAAARYLRDTCNALELRGNNGELSTYVSELARVLCRLGRYDEAERCAQQGRELGVPEDIMTQFLWRQAQALVESARGHNAKALRLAGEAVEFSRQTDSPLTQGNALIDLTQVLEAAGRPSEAAATLREAIGCYERKEVVPLAQRARAKLAALPR